MVAASAVSSGNSSSSHGSSAPSITESAFNESIPSTPEVCADNSVPSFPHQPVGDEFLGCQGVRRLSGDSGAFELEDDSDSSAMAQDKFFSASKPAHEEESSSMHLLQDDPIGSSKYDDGYERIMSTDSNESVMSSDSSASSHSTVVDNSANSRCTDSPCSMDMVAAAAPLTDGPIPEELLHSTGDNNEKSVIEQLTSTLQRAALNETNTVMVVPTTTNAPLESQGGKLTAALTVPLCISGEGGDVMPCTSLSSEPIDNIHCDSKTTVKTLASPHNTYLPQTADKVLPPSLDYVEVTSNS